MIDFKSFLSNYAADIKGQYEEYDDQRAVIIVPLKEGRFQSVVGKVTEIGENKRMGVAFTSKVCEYRHDLDFRAILKGNAAFTHGRLALVNDFIQMDAAAFLDNVSEELLKEIITEVANCADEWEFKLTGEDIY